VADETHSGADNLREHQELIEMAETGAEMSDVIALRGYVGPSPREGVVRLYPGLDDMSVSVDIPSGEIVATKDAPKVTMPMGGVIVWVTRTANVTVRRTRTVLTTAQQVKRLFGAGSAMDPSRRGVVDRLNIRLPKSSARRTVPPVYQPPDPNVCTSQCEIVCTESCYTCQSLPE
jgi:hypothetical protein